MIRANRPARRVNNRRWPVWYYLAFAGITLWVRGLEMDLTGKVALVTGAQQGIGAAIAREFARAGADVAINWLDDEEMAGQVADAVRQAGRRATLYQDDVIRLEATRAMVEAVERD